MSLKKRKKWQHPEILKLIQATGGKKDPVDIVREKARSFVKIFYGKVIKGPPFSPEILASLIGAKVEYKRPILDSEAQLIPFPDHFLIRCNPYRPRVRQNFSLFHEISHLLLMNLKINFPCKRTQKKEFDINNEIEYLCDISAAELLLPLPWFSKDMEKLGISVQSLLTLCKKYIASREAVAIRVAQLSSLPLAAVFFSWRNKPQEEKSYKPEKKEHLFLFPEIKPLPPKKLRVDFSVPSSSFPYFIPQFKSVEEKTLIYKSSLDGKIHQGIEWINLVNSNTQFYVETLPLTYRGAKPPYRVLALLRPID